MPPEALTVPAMALRTVLSLAVILTVLALVILLSSVLLLLSVAESIIASVLLEPILIAVEPCNAAPELPVWIPTPAPIA